MEGRNNVRERETSRLRYYVGSYVYKERIRETGERAAEKKAWIQVDKGRLYSQIRGWITEDKNTGGKERWEAVRMRRGGEGWGGEAEENVVGRGCHPIGMRYARSPWSASSLVQVSGPRDAE